MHALVIDDYSQTLLNSASLTEGSSARGGSAAHDSFITNTTTVQFPGFQLAELKSVPVLSLGARDSRCSNISSLMFMGD